MEKNSDYSAKNIELLEGLEAVRKVPGMYIGSTNSYGLHHLVWEIIDNALDEALNGYGNKISVTIHKDNSVTVTDEGRGIPCDIQKQTGRPAIEVIFTTLHSGGKFNEEAYANSAGLHGVGTSVTNALSEYTDVISNFKGKIYHIRFERGRKISVPLEVLGTTNKHGTTVTFKPDKQIFNSIELSYETIASRIKDNAYLLPGVKFLLTDERTNTKEEFYYEHGIPEYLAEITANKSKINPEVIYFNGEESKIKVDIAIQYCYDEYSETLRSFANNVHTVDGGTHEVGFRMALTKVVNDYIDEFDLAKGKAKPEGNDIREGLTAIVSVRMSEEILEFEGQTKTKLGTQLAQSAVYDILCNKLSYYLRENKEFAILLVKKCIDSANARLAARKAKDEARNKKKPKDSIILSDKLTPAQSKDYSKNELFIVEGDSAGGTAKKGRNPYYQAILPLRGKPLNTDGLTIDKINANLEFATIINTIGAGVGNSFDVEDIHYDKIIIMTDADTDGAHIQTLLLTFFYNYMRPLITNGHVYCAVPPLYRVYKEDKFGKTIIEKYAWDDESLEKCKQEVGAGYKVSRYKGLGEMSDKQLKDTTMDPKNRLLVRISINDALVVETKVETLMGKDTEKRKKWLEQNVDFNESDSFMKEVVK